MKQPFASILQEMDNNDVIAQYVMINDKYVVCVFYQLCNLLTSLHTMIAVHLLHASKHNALYLTHETADLR